MNMKNTNFRLKEQCKGQQVEAEQHLKLTENSNVFLLCHSIIQKWKSNVFVHKVHQSSLSLHCVPAAMLRVQGSVWRRRSVYQECSAQRILITTC